MEEAERWHKHQYRVYCLGRSPVEGEPNKTVRAHCHTQAWARYRGLRKSTRKVMKGYCYWATKKDKL
jgi:hypothetical protein